MAMIGVRVDDDIDKMITEMATKRSVSKSDFVRNLLLKGLEAQEDSGEILNEIYEGLLKSSLLTEKNFKLTAKILTLLLKVLDNTGQQNEEKLEKDIQLANAEAREILIKAGVME